MQPQPRWTRYRPRDLGNAWYAIDDLREEVDKLYTADAIAAAVAEKFKRERLVVVGAGGKIVAAVVAIATLVTAVHAWFG